MIRPARAGDVAAAEAVVRAAYAPYVPRIGREPGPMGDDYAALVARGAAWVAEEGGEVLGLLVLEDRPGALLLDNVAVAPAAQGRGVGRALVAFAEGEARRRGHARVELYTNEAMAENLALYARWGFAETGRGEQAGFRRVFMAKAV